MELLVQLIVGTAWPLTVIWVAHSFRGELKALLSRMSHFKYKDAEAKFESILIEAEANVAAVEQAATPALPAPDSISKYHQLRRIAEVSPRAAIMESWVLVEDAAGSAGYVQGATIPRVNVLLFVDDLVKEGKLPLEASNLIENLRKLRNQASHVSDFRLSQEEADRYIKLAVKISGIIVSIN